MPEGRCPVRWTGQRAVMSFPEQVDVSNAGLIREQMLAVVSRGAAAGDDPTAMAIAAAIRGALSGNLPDPVTVEVPCHSPNTGRWFDMMIGQAR